MSLLWLPQGTPHNPAEDKRSTGLVSYWKILSVADCSISQPFLLCVSLDFYFYPVRIQRVGRFQTHSSQCVYLIFLFTSVADGQIEEALSVSQGAINETSNNDLAFLSSCLSDSKNPPHLVSSIFFFFSWDYIFSKPTINLPIFGDWRIRWIHFHLESNAEASNCDLEWPQRKVSSPM